MRRPSSSECTKTVSSVIVELRLYKVADRDKVELAHEWEIKWNSSATTAASNAIDGQVNIRPQPAPWINSPSYVEVERDVLHTCSPRAGESIALALVLTDEA